MKTVCIVCGGRSHEHEISLMSAYSVLCNIDREKYDVHTIIIDKDGSFFHTQDLGELKNEGWKSLKGLASCIIAPDPKYNGILVETENGFENIKIDVFFPVLHGEMVRTELFRAYLNSAACPTLEAEF